MVYQPSTNFEFHFLRVYMSGNQHKEKYNAKKKETREGSFIFKHQQEHGGKEPNMKEQRVWVGRCESAGSIIHEIMHKLGKKYYLCL